MLMIEKGKIIDATLCSIFGGCVVSLSYLIYNYEEPVKEEPKNEIIFIVMNSYDNKSCK